MKTLRNIKTLFAITLLTTITTASAKTITATAQGDKYPDIIQVPTNIVNGDFFITDKGSQTTTGDGDNEITNWELDFRSNFGGDFNKMRKFLKSKKKLCSAVLSLKMHPGESNGMKGDVIGIVGLRPLGKGLPFRKNWSDISETQNIKFDLLDHYSAKEINNSLSSTPMGAVHLRYFDDAVISKASLKLDYRAPRESCSKGAGVGYQFNLGDQLNTGLIQGTDGGQEGTPPGTSFGLGDGLGLEAADGLAADPGPASLAPVSLSVTADSVVATAVVTVNSEQRKLKLYWGDDQVEHINLLSPSLSLGNGNGEVKEVDGGVQYTFQHVYQAPGGRKIIIAVSTDAEGEKSNITKAVDIEARYKLSFYPISLEFPDHLDSIFENESEIRAHLNVTQGTNLLFHKYWKKDIVTNPDIVQPDVAIRWRIDGSQFSQEVSVTDEPIGIYLVIGEQDGIYEDGSLANDAWDIVSAPFRLVQYIKEEIDVEFEPYVTDPPFYIHPNDSSVIGDKSRSYTRISAHEIGNEEGSVYSTFSYDFKLIVPITRSERETRVFTMD